MVITYSESKDQPGKKVANPARGQLNRQNDFSLSPFAPENLVSRDGFGSPVPRQRVPRQPNLLISVLRLRIWCLLTGTLPISAAASIYLCNPPYAIGSIPSSSGHAITYRWRSLPRVRRHRASKPQGSSERVLPWQVTMDLSFSYPLVYW